jgi:hypothetical protein
MFAPLAAVALLAAPLAAQGRDEGDRVPPDQRPPAGMCRIWLDNVPAGQQPAPTDCATAVRNRPPNGRVIFGDEPRGGNRGAKPKKLRGAPSEWRTRDSSERPDGDGYATRERDGPAPDRGAPDGDPGP